MSLLPAVRWDKGEEVGDMMMVVVVKGGEIVGRKYALDIPSLCRGEGLRAGKWGGVRQ